MNYDLGIRDNYTALNGRMMELLAQQIYFIKQLQNGAQVKLKKMKLYCVTN